MRFTRLERNWDVPSTQHKMELFNNKARTMGASKFSKLGVYGHVVQWYLLNNCEDERWLHKVSWAHIKYF